jgi:hypothetical protein
MCVRIIVAVAVACVLGAPFAALGADTMRCDRAIVRVGMIAGEVIAKCGDPKSTRVDEVPVRARNRNGAANVVGVTKIETWIYDRGYGQFPAELKFEEGKLKSIEYLTAR